MKTLKYYFFVATVFLLFSACSENEDGGFGIESNYYGVEDYKLIQAHLNLPNEPLSYKQDFPLYYGSRTRDFNQDLATLGRVLFYDKNLSSDASVSCGSCHKQSLAFSDDKSFSDGVSNRKTSRNSQPLGAVFSFAEYYGPDRVPFFWDNRAGTVEEQARQTFANEDEMSMPIEEVTQRVNELPYYSPLLKYATGREVATEDDVLRAVSEFVNSMGSFESKFDVELSKQGHINIFDAMPQEVVNNFSGYTASENAGKALYLANCASCHGAIMGVPGVVQANNGLDLVYEDQGIGRLGNSVLNGVFKVPTLRNITLTYPYMHDGRFETLEDVLEHYSTGIKDHPNLGSELPVGGFNFTEAEKSALLDFMETLTDDNYLTAEKYADPFK